MSTDKPDQGKKNLSLWAAVCKTSPSYTRHVNQRGGFTAIDPTYQAQKATEVFGMYGVGWGLRNVLIDYGLHESTGMVVMKGEFFYRYDSQEGSFPVHNAIKTCSGFGDKSRADEDFAKKLETNILSKALSRLGFSADVFLGLFDDTGYVETAKTREAIERADNAEEAQRDEQEVVRAGNTDVQHDPQPGRTQKRARRAQSENRTPVSGRRPELQSVPESVP
jgi:hypothetical protein